jgi:hypothetical protein
MSKGAEIPRNLARTVVTFAIALTTLLAPSASAQQNTEKTLTSLRAIHSLSNAEASHQLPVSFESTVTYYRPYEKTLFVQDGDVAIYIQRQSQATLKPGDRVLIKGTTHESFRPFVSASSITVVGTANLPTAVPATFEQLIRADFDCRLVTVRARVRTVNLVRSSDIASISMEMRTDGGVIDAVIDSDNVGALKD